MTDTVHDSRENISQAREPFGEPGLFSQGCWRLTKTIAELVSLATC